MKQRYFIVILYNYIIRKCIKTVLKNNVLISCDSIFLYNTKSTKQKKNHKNGLILKIFK